MTVSGQVIGSCESLCLEVTVLKMMTMATRMAVVMMMRVAFLKLLLQLVVMMITNR